MLRVNALPRRALAAALAAIAALALTMLMLVPAAMAAEGVTRQLAGVSFTVPSDWEEIDVSGLVGEAESSGAGLDDVEAAAYGREDGVFFGMAAQSSDFEVRDDVSSEALAAAAAYIEAELENNGLEGVSVAGDVEQGLPTITFQTTDVHLNGVAYAVTAKLFLGAGSGDEAVLMVAALPASGQVTEGFEDTFQPLDEATPFDAGGISYLAPAGYYLVQGDALGFGFAIVTDYDDERGVATLSFPDSAGLFDGATTSDLNELADELYSEVSGEDGLEGSLEAFWCDAYDFLGFPTLGMEGVYDDPDEGDVYFCATLSVTGEGLSVLIAAQPEGDGLVEAVLGSAEAEPGAATAASAAQGSDPGFVVGSTTAA